MEWIVTTTSTNLMQILKIAWYTIESAVEYRDVSIKNKWIDTIYFEANWIDVVWDTWQELLNGDVAEIKTKNIQDIFLRSNTSDMIIKVAITN